MPVASVRRLSRASATGVVLLLSLGLAATGSSSASPTANPATANTAGGTPSPKTLVRQIALVDADFTDGSTVARIYRGNKVRGQVTLDNCGFNFTTEKRRVARHQTMVIPATPRKVFLSNEVVAYETAHFAAKALRQMRKSVLQCPADIFLPSEVIGQPELRYDVSKVRTSAKLPVADNAVVTLKVTIKASGKHAWGVFIFQRRGTVLDGLYRQSRKKPSAAKVAALRSLATITGNRLAAT
jgi:hypothetical protein